MNISNAFSPHKLLTLLLLLACLLSACGGTTDFASVVTGVKVQSVQYGKSATIYIGGKDLRSSLTVDSW